MRVRGPDDRDRRRPSRAGRRRPTDTTETTTETDDRDDRRRRPAETTPAEGPVQARSSSRRTAAAATRSRTRARPARSGPTSTTRSPTRRLVVDRVTNGQGVDAAVQGHADASSRSRTSRRTSPPPRAAEPPCLRLPAASRGARVRPRPDADRGGRASCARARTPRSRAARAAGIPVIIATDGCSGRSRPYALAAGITEPVVCYQGAVVADPGRRRVPPPRADAAGRRRTRSIEATADLGHTVLCYVDDELYVARETPASDAYARLPAPHVTSSAISRTG